MPAAPGLPAKPDGLPQVPILPPDMIETGDGPREIPVPTPARDEPVKDIPDEVPPPATINEFPEH